MEAQGQHYVDSHQHFVNMFKPIHYVIRLCAFSKIYCNM